MDYISELPCELLDIILMQDNISIEDVTNLGETCEMLNIKIWKRKNNTLFRRLFFKRWPGLEEICKTKWDKQVDIGIEVTKRIECQTRFSKYFSEFIYQIGHNFNLERLINQMEHVNLFNAQEERNLQYYYFEDELMEILANDRNKDNNITEIYFARKLLFYIKRSYLEKEWDRYKELPAEQQILEKIATMIAQWCQPEKRLFYSHVSTMFDNLVQEILRLLKERYPTHSIFSTSPEFSFWERNNINANYWNAVETKQIINVIRGFIYDRFTLTDSLLIINPEDFLIDRVLETKAGNSMSLSIIFGCAARRLGVRCDLISRIEQPFLLCWKENYDNINPETYYIIDTSRDGPIVNEDNDYLGISVDPNTIGYNINATELVKYIISVISPLSYCTKMKTLDLSLKYFYYTMDYHSIRRLELVEHAVLWRGNPYVGLAEYWMLLNKDINWQRCWQETSFKNMQKKFDKYLQWQTCLTPRNRKGKVKYAVGMTVKIENHTRYSECVIVGWDLKLDKNYFKLIYTDEEYSMIKIYKKGGRRRPFYKLLCSGDTSFYISEDIIVPVKLNNLIDHNEIGRYFKSFQHTHYLPNTFLEEAYPEDEAVRKRYAAILS